MTPLLDSTAVRRRPDGVVRVAGADRLAYLHSLLSASLESARPGDVADFLHLEAGGTALAMGRAVVRSGEVWLVVPEVVVPALTDTLSRFTFLLDASAQDLSASMAVASVRGPGVLEVPGARSEAMTAAPHGDGVIVRDRSGGVDLVGAAAWVEERLEAMGLPEAAGADWEAWRIAAGIPAWGSEVADGRRPQELGLLPTHVHLRKGCYPGQESIAKIHNLGRPRRALAVVSSAGSIAVGDPVAVEGTRSSGLVTSAAPTGDGWVALALVPVDRSGVLPETVAVGAVEARVTGRVGDGVLQPGA